MAKKCFDCPVIREEMLARINYLDDGLYDAEDIESMVISSCWCDKVGGKLSMCGRCSNEHMTEDEWEQLCLDNDLEYEALSEEDGFQLQETKIQRKRNRDRKYKESLRRLYQNKRNSWICSVYPCNTLGSYTEEDEEDFVRYKRVYNPRRAKYLKRMCNKRVRRGKDVPNRGGYRKYSEYSWELW